MSNSVFSRKCRPSGSVALAASFLITGLLAGCSTDVQRFGHTGSLGSTAAVQPAPVQPVERAPLGLAGGPSRVNAGSSYVNNAVHDAAATARPSPYGSLASTPAGRLVSVNPGDTAFSLARANGITVQDLAAANDLAFPYNIKIGQQLTIPGAGGAAAAATPAPVRVASRAGGSHTVSSGDTLFNISRRYGVGVDRLAEANNLDDFGRIRIGQTLRIPDGGSASAAGGPLKLAARTVETGGEAAGAPRVLKPRVVEPVAAPSGAETRNETEAAAPPAQSSASKFRWPARGRIISRYGVSADGQRNDGINISVPEGASVKAAEGGVVAYAGDELKGYGNLVLIRHANDWVTAYAHNSTLLVKRGETVQRGQIIAKAGQTGSVDKPQLHFEVRQGSKAVDPMPYLEGA